MSELYHHGILGMKWGVRRTPEQLGHKGEKKKRTSDDHRTATAKKAKQMSTEELKKSLERMRMEDEYNRLTASTAKKGRQKAAQVLVDSGPMFVKAVVGASAALVAKRFVSTFLEGNGMGKVADFIVNDGVEKALATAGLMAQLKFAPIR